MTRTRIKICGIRTLETAMAAVDAGADAIGLVFAQASPRSVTMDEAKRIAAALPPMVEPIGLFVDQPTSQVLATAAQVGLRTVQLHGRETPDHLAELTPLRVIKALAFETRDVAQRLAPWRGRPANLAAILWDAPPPTADGLPGGSGRAFDWRALAGVDRSDLPPTILAGGLTPDNVAQAIAMVRPYAVDVSSGVESSRGVKDVGRIRAFCEAVATALP